MSDPQKRPIIRKIIAEEDHKPHGGAWKVAYADLMTAMMAFFLLMWLLASADDAQLEALADYFTPSSARQEQEGGAGLLWGQSPGVQGVNGEPADETMESAGAAETDPNKSPAFGPETGMRPQVEARHADELPPQAGPVKTAEDIAAEKEAEARKKLQEEQLAKLVEARAQREAQLGMIEEEIRNSLLNEDNMTLLENIEFRITSEGLLVQILDRDNQPVFETGSAVLGEKASALVVAVSGAISRVIYPIAIAGHTDARPYSGLTDYSNWELSTDRANSARRLMITSGVDIARISEVSGHADTEPLMPEDVMAAENRRIDILLRYPDPLLQADTLQP